MSDDDVFEQLNHLAHALKSRMRSAILDETEGFPPMAARALAFIVRHPGSTPSQLVAHSGRDKAQVARLLRYLEEERYVTRAPDPDDRRSYTIVLTERGRVIEKKMQAHRKRVVHDLLGGLTGPERAQLAALLGRLIANLDGQG